MNLNENKDNLNELDKERYKRFINGDVEGFEELVLAYKNMLIYFLNRYLQDLNIAEDIAQDAFVDVYVYKERYNGKTSFKTYLFTIGRNKAIDYIRKNKQMQYTVNIEEQTEISSDEDELIDYIIQQENKGLIAHTLERMKEEYARVLILIDFEDFSYKEAADVLGKTTSQVKVLIHRARKSLRKMLEEEGFTYEE
ncbi:MAG: RNA polymerase sigma factor [Clostridiales bacterium]|nr:RNA polymerase sigma factor [uncultured Anaerosporobacter sp.]MBS5934741.1 RNA polymerase sigma factor [Clostridiales bacterium]